MKSRRLLIGCGILQNEVRHIIQTNGWPMDMLFLDSALHINLPGLEKGLSGALTRNSNRKIIVFYGCCHPRMESILEQAGADRIPGQNCIEMLLGPEIFKEELQSGAFFLLEEWAQKWEAIITTVFGTRRLDIIREIFRGDRKYLLALRTPCSAPFEEEARKAAEFVDLPLRWKDAPLNHLESLLRDSLEQKRTVEWKSR